MTDRIPEGTNLEGWAERNELCGEYFPKIALSRGTERRRLLCGLAGKLFDSFASRRVTLVTSLDDIPAFDDEQKTYLGRVVEPSLPDLSVDDLDRQAIELTIVGCKRKWLGDAINRARGSEALVSLEDAIPRSNEPEDHVSDRPAGEKIEGGRAAPTHLGTIGTIFEGLTASGIADFRVESVRDAYHEAFAEFAQACDEVLTNELPRRKPRSHLGIRAAALRLSKRLADLAETYFGKFATGIDERVDKDSDPDSTGIWRNAVIQEWTKTLWRDIDEVWTTWLNHIRTMTEGTVFGARPYPIGDPELEILKAHQKLMRSTLWSIAAQHSIPRETVHEILSVDEVTRQPNVIFPARSESNEPERTKPESAPPSQVEVPPTGKQDSQVGPVGTDSGSAHGAPPDADGFTSDTQLGASAQSTQSSTETKSNAETLEDVSAQEADQASRAKARSDWLNQKLAQHKTWTSDTDIADKGGPTYNTIRRYRSGATSTRDLYVRRGLANAFECTVDDVPK
jgi:hypothetical protein